MELSQILESAQRLKEAARISAIQCSEASLRLVTIEVYFQMPDHPHVLNSFSWQTEDRFEAGGNISREFQGVSKGFSVVSDGVETVLAADMARYQATVRAAWQHAERMDRTAPHFEIRFSDFPGNPLQHQRLVASVPFPRTRGFLGHWLQEIEGPIHTAAITHSPPYQERPRLYGLPSRRVN